ncbi:MAG: hypothetical protein E7537_03060 [Ruminococcaceae bacterium]|nr:hypothetical protein [Oscillospiraceae bacterium]
MKFLKALSLILVFVFVLSLCGCKVPDKTYGVTSEGQTANGESLAQTTSVPEITSLDSKMSKYFDISVFDEENYADIYLGKKFEINAVYANSYFSVPSTIEEIAKSGWKLVKGSDYDDNSLVYAKETVELVFENEKGAKITALFYNSSNSSIRLINCEIVKFSINNGYFKNKKKYSQFNICGITNTAVITDIINILGTPSHFYKKTDNTYYFDYFLEKRDRRNKIRIHIDLEDDAITAIEFSNYD